MKLNDILNEQELLLELGDAPYPWRWSSSPPNANSTSSTEKGGDAKFTDDDGDRFEVNMFYKSMTDTTSIYWTKNNRYSGENTKKSPVRIIFTIMDIIKKYIELIQPKYITFTANKALFGSRGERNKLSSLYTTIINRFAAKAGYSADISGGEWDTSFILHRDKN